MSRRNPTLLRVFLRGRVQTRSFSSTAPLRLNRIYDSIRNEHDFHTALRLSTQAHAPLIAMFTATYCPACRPVLALLRDIVETRPETDRKSVQVAEVELDAQGGGLMEVGQRYFVNSLPMLLPFYRGMPLEELRLVNWRDMRDRAWLSEWVEEVAEMGGAPRGLLGGLFGR